jgi:hypothetical protein
MPGSATRHDSAVKCDRPTLMASRGSITLSVSATATEHASAARAHTDEAAPHEPRIQGSVAVGQKGRNIESA